MTNLEAVFLYVRQHAPSAATGDGTGKFRDLLRFYFTKQDRWEKGGTTEEKARVRTLVSVPLTVCGVAPDGEDLLLRANEQKLALTATVMTMSIVLNLQQDALTRLKQKLERLSSGQLQELFKTFLTKGDLVTSKHSGLELKNFGCLGELQEKYMTRAENAFVGAKELLTTANHEFLSQPALRIPLEIDVVFRLYFGDPNATIASKLLSFLPGTPPYPWDAVVSRSAVVHAVLSRVWRGLMTTEKANIVRLYYGGSEITPNVEAYTNQKVRDGRINVHLGTDFFDKHGEPVMKNQMSSSRSAVLVHEYTHALAGTKDFPGAYSPASCRKMASTDDRYGLPCRSLLSAQSYASFVEDAFA